MSNGNYEGIPVYEEFAEDVNGSDSSVAGLGDGDVKTTKYWIYSPGERANMWDEFYEKGIMAIGWEIGDLTKFKSKEEISKALQDYYNDNKLHTMDVHCLWQFAHDIQVGDIIFVKRGRNDIVGRGIVTSDYKFNKGQYYPHSRTVQWIDKGIWSMKKNWDERTKSLPLKTLTEFTMYTHILNQIKDLFEEEDVESIKEYPSYLAEDLIEAFISPHRSPRDEYNVPILRKDVLKIEDLKKGMKLQGVVRNVVDFGAFVDIGLKNDGLIHISKMSSHKVKHALDVCHVGDILDVYVYDVDLKKKRVALSLMEVA